jgi:hypothetical protein
MALSPLITGEGQKTSSRNKEGEWRGIWRDNRHATTTNPSSSFHGEYPTSCKQQLEDSIILVRIKTVFTKMPFYQWKEEGVEASITDGCVFLASQLNSDYPIPRMLSAELDVPPPAFDVNEKAPWVVPRANLRDVEGREPISPSYMGHVTHARTRNIKARTNFDVNNDEGCDKKVVIVKNYDKDEKNDDSAEKQSSFYQHRDRYNATSGRNNYQIDGTGRALSLMSLIRLDHDDLCEEEEYVGCDNSNSDTDSGLYLRSKATNPKLSMEVMEGRPKIKMQFHVIFSCLIFFALMPPHICVLGCEHVGENYHGVHSIRGAKASMIEPSNGDERDGSIMKKLPEVWKCCCLIYILF